MPSTSAMQLPQSPARQTRRRPGQIPHGLSSIATESPVSYARPRRLTIGRVRQDDSNALRRPSTNSMATAPARALAHRSTPGIPSRLPHVRSRDRTVGSRVEDRYRRQRHRRGWIASTARPRVVAYAAVRPARSRRIRTPCGSNSGSGWSRAGRRRPMISISKPLAAASCVASSAGRTQARSTR